MADAYYCKLYVDSDEGHEALQEIVDAYVREAFSGIAAEGTVFRNENFEPGRDKVKPYDFIEASRNYVELDSDEDSEGEIFAFQMGTVRLINLLRGGGRIVTASCSFEDLVISETGWNWTEANPNPPRAG